MWYKRAVELLNELAEQCGQSSVCDVDAEGGGHSEVFVPCDEEGVVRVQEELDVCECGAARAPLDIVMGRASRHCIMFTRGFCSGAARREGGTLGIRDWLQRHCMCARR